MVHGDDFTFTGDEAALKWAEEFVSGWFEAKVRARLGPDDHNDKEADASRKDGSMAGVGSFVRGKSEAQGRQCWRPWTCSKDSKILMSPGTNEVNKDDSRPNVVGDDRNCKSIVATINSMATDMPDLQFACKKACREVLLSTVQPRKKTKRTGRHLLGRVVVLKFPWKNGDGSWKGFSLTVIGLATLETLKSTSGDIIMLGEHRLKTWKPNQSSPALGSSEAEYYAVVDGASRALGVQTAAKELGITVEHLSVEMATDSSGAKSFASRRGSGRLVAAGGGRWKVPV